MSDHPDGPFPCQGSFKYSPEFYLPQALGGRLRSIRWCSSLPLYWVRCPHGFCRSIHGDLTLAAVFGRRLGGFVRNETNGARPPLQLDASCHQETTCVLKAWRLLRLILRFVAVPILRLPPDFSFLMRSSKRRQASFRHLLYEILPFKPPVPSRKRTPAARSFQPSLTERNDPCRAKPKSAKPLPTALWTPWKRATCPPGVKPSSCPTFI
jgi:hypothetical protein